MEVSIIGIGRMGMHYLKVIAGLRNARIKGIADPRANADEIGEVIVRGERIFLSGKELFKYSSPDVVHVFSSFGTHCLYGKTALENGGHVFIEKPFVLKEGQAKEVVHMA